MPQADTMSSLFIHNFLRSQFWTIFLLSFILDQFFIEIVAACILHTPVTSIVVETGSTLGAPWVSMVYLMGGADRPVTARKSYRSGGSATGSLRTAPLAVLYGAHVLHG